MTILMHVCCGPCALYPLTVLREEGIRVRGLFFNPNIHPFREFRRRLETMESVADAFALPVDFERRYGLKEYLRQVVFHEKERCGLCYAMRLAATVERAMAVRADAFTTTLLYSRYQNHEKIRAQAEELSRLHKIPFYYRDFREGWQQGIDMAKERELYRQPYCGCIYSEQERYDKRLGKGKDKM